MKTEQFLKLIASITGRELFIKNNPSYIQTECEYYIYRILPLTQRKISFKWISPKSEDKLLSSFVTAFTTKYREPNPINYNCSYGGKVYTWAEKSAIEKEYAYSHHISNMFSKEELTTQIEANFNSPEIESVMLRHGFYPTEYGIGIFILYETSYVSNAVNQMMNFLKCKAYPFSNEYSEKGWVLRFKLGLTKEIHTNILESLKI